ncbi:pyrroline-5-carboxylate reductase [bacterium]|nr:pyrroline-5-carboxylate reductase [bacterium]
MKLGIIGLGNMAEAILSGITTKTKSKKALFKGSDIIGFDVDQTKAKKLKKKYKITLASQITDVFKGTAAVLIAVKPQNLDELSAAVRSSVTPKHLILSILAGKTTGAFETHFGGHCRVVRLMPNTPALIGLGATAFYANHNCKPADKQITKKIFASVGDVLEVKDENLLDAVTGLSGSGPAYVYSFIDALISGGIEAGLSPDTAKNLAIKTIQGATELFIRSKDTAENLIAKVASKGGTTEAGLAKLAEKGFKETVVACVKRATQRAKELR